MCHPSLRISQKEFLFTLPSSRFSVRVSASAEATADLAEALRAKAGRFGSGPALLAATSRKRIGHRLEAPDYCGALRNIPEAIEVLDIAGNRAADMSSAVCQTFDQCGASGRYSHLDSQGEFRVQAF